MDKIEYNHGYTWFDLEGLNELKHGNLDGSIPEYIYDGKV